MDPHTLESRIDIGQEINVGSEKFVKNNKRGALKFAKNNRHKT
jgi:hypothetical protein